MSIVLPDLARDQAITSIQQYAEAEMDEPMGTLAAGALLDFFLEQIAPSVYNRAIADVQERLQLRVMEIDVELHQAEFPHTPRRGPDRSGGR